MNNTFNLVRWLRLAPLLLAAWLVAPAALALDSGDIVVVSSKGEVHLTQNGAAAKIRAGAALQLPAAIRTGRDGAVELKQGATTVSVGPDTLLEFPALEKRGGPIDRVVQPRGNAFYSIGKRDGRKLRVETPYLVGVVKGTQFNVAAQDESTTISLFEGLLEVRATDDSAVVDLKAGEIASRRRGEKNINVIKMEPGKTPTTAPRPQSNGNGSGPDEGRPQGRPVLVDRESPAGGVIGTVIDTVNGNPVSANVSVDVRTPAAGVDLDASVDTGRDGVNVNAAANVNAAGVVDAGVNTNVSVGNDGVSADISVNTGVDAGAATVDVNASANVDVGASGVAADVNTGATVDTGLVSAGVDTSTSIDVGPSGIAAGVDTSTTVDAGPVTADIDTGTSVDIGSSGVVADVGVDAAVDTGIVAADVDTGAAVDLGAGTVDTSLDTGVTAGPVDVPVAADVGVDVSTGTVDLGVSVAGVDLDVGLDLGLDNGNDDTDTGSPTTDTTTDTSDTIIDVGGLLDGLLRRPGRN